MYVEKLVFLFFLVMVIFLDAFQNIIHIVDQLFENFLKEAHTVIETKFKLLGESSNEKNSNAYRTISWFSPCGISLKYCCLKYSKFQ